MFSQQDLIQALGDQLISFSGSLDGKTILDITLDSRQTKAGSLFLALKGGNFDGHDFIEAALKNGALAALGEKNKPELAAFFHVKNSIQAYANLASYHRRKNKARIFAVSGSNGKTTVKNFAHSILSSQAQGIKSPKSFNNHIGVPWALLSLGLEDQFGVLELGMNHAGELKDLTLLANPDFCVVTGVHPAHIGNFESLDKVALAKAELYKYAPKEAVFAFNLDDPFTFKMRQDYLDRKQITFSAKDKSADIFLQAQPLSLSKLRIQGHIQGQAFDESINLSGDFHAVNLMAAAAMALDFGLKEKQIIEGFKFCKNAPHRTELFKTPSGADVLFDAYNANPKSFQALLDYIKKIPTSGRLFFILGSMNELGNFSNEAHKTLGAQVSALSPEKVVFFGPEGTLFEQGFFPKNAAPNAKKNLVISDAYDFSLANSLYSVLEPNDVLILKASRSVQLERLLEAWSLGEDATKNT